jgi:hypothetical protein
MQDRCLIDKSALARWTNPSVREVLKPLHERYLLRICQPTEYEMIHSARDSAEATRISTWLHAFDYLRADDDTFTRALEIQRHALNSGFHRALSLPDLLIAATAEDSGQRSVPDGKAGYRPFLEPQPGMTAPGLCQHPRGEIDAEDRHPQLGQPSRHPPRPAPEIGDRPPARFGGGDQVGEGGQQGPVQGTRDVPGRKTLGVDGGHLVVGSAGGGPAGGFVHAQNVTRATDNPRRARRRPIARAARWGEILGQRGDQLVPAPPALTPATNVANAAVDTRSTGPAGHLESRTGTVPREATRFVATSTHWPPLPL